MNAYKAHDPDAGALVILPPQHITLPEVLRHIEAGKIVLIIPDSGHQGTAEASQTLSQEQGI